MSIHLIVLSVQLVAIGYQLYLYWLSRKYNQVNKDYNDLTIKLCNKQITVAEADIEQVNIDKKLEKLKKLPFQPK